jgi:hypothetical protein
LDRPTTVILIPASDDQRLPTTTVLDLALQRSFSLPRGALLNLDLQLLNALNEDEHQFFESLMVNDGFVPSTYILPRRLMLRLGIRF